MERDARGEGGGFVRRHIVRGLGRRSGLWGSCRARLDGVCWTGVLGESPHLKAGEEAEGAGWMGLRGPLLLDILLVSGNGVTLLFS